MEVAERRQPLRASERPLRATGSGQEAASGEPGSTDPGAGENGQRGAERRIVRRFCPRSSMPCMPVVSQAGNQVTWNLFLCGGVRKTREARGQTAPVHATQKARLGTGRSVPYGYFG